MTDEPGVIGYCYALYDYLALEPNQLSLRRGDRVTVVSKAGASRGWWKGRLRGKVTTLYTDFKNVKFVFYMTFQWHR